MSDIAAESKSVTTKDGGNDLPVQSEVYKKRGKMGKFAIFYHTEVEEKKPIPGTEVDAKNLSTAVRNLGFEPIRHKDMHCKPFLDQLDAYAAEDHSNSTCFALAIFTHGDYDDVMYASDGCDYNLWQVLEKFTARNCQSLKGIPKFFLINTCRGNQHDKTFSAHTSQESRSKVLTIPTHPDFIIAHSTCPDHKAWVNYKAGSVFITKFCEAIADENLHNFQDILTWVNGSTPEMIIKQGKAGCLQMPTFSSQLTAELHLRGRSPRELPENWYYKMDHPKRGSFYIFCDERDDDVKQLELAARSLKFTPKYFEKQTHQEMQDIASKYIEEKHQDHDCFVCVIKTDSFQHDELYDGNKQKYNLKEFVQRFHGIECPALNGKPKIFIIQAPYDMESVGGDESTTKHTIPDTADTLIFYSTSPASNQPEGGTLFIHTLCEHLQELSNTGFDLLSVFSLVTQRMAQRRGLHTPTVTSQLRKRLFFRGDRGYPGHGVTSESAISTTKELC